MPVKSEAQRRYMEGVAKGDIKSKGLSKEQAQEFLDKTPKKKHLPEKVKDDKKD